MSGSVKVLRLRSGFFGIFREMATIEAESQCRKCYDSFLGSRVFYMNEGRRRQVHVPKGMYVEGESVDFSHICTSDNAFDFSWDWGY